MLAAAMCKIHFINPDIKIIIFSGFNKEELSERLTDTLLMVSFLNQ